KPPPSWPPCCSAAIRVELESCWRVEKRFSCCNDAMSCGLAPVDSSHEHICMFSGSSWTETSREEPSGAAPAKIPIAITATARATHSPFLRLTRIGLLIVETRMKNYGRIVYQRFKWNNFFAGGYVG